MRFIRYLVPLIVIVAAVSCTEILPPAPESADVLAEPMDGLTNEQMKTHLIGDGEFAKVFSAAEGLGPIFVSTSCESCHVGDGKGHPLTMLTRFGRDNNGQFDHLLKLGGPQLQGRAIAGFPPEEIPAEATGVTKLLAPAVTGLGFLEAVPDEALLSLADPEDSDGDGISGVPNYLIPPDYFQPSPSNIGNNGMYIGRFGKKAGAINLLHQVVNAYNEDMGITSEFRPHDPRNYKSGLQSGDNVDSPEVGTFIVNNVVFYVRTLKAPTRRDENNPDVKAGEQLFSKIGCDGCHTPVMMTGPSDVAALDRKEFYPYTDLLMHDMGSELDDGYTEGSALTSEWRTAPLWGIGLAEDSQGGQTFFLHDGRATTLEEAIEYHGGEGATSREKFRALSANEKTQLIKFLKSL